MPVIRLLSVTSKFLKPNFVSGFGFLSRKISFRCSDCCLSNQVVGCQYLSYTIASVGSGDISQYGCCLPPGGCTGVRHFASNQDQQLKFQPCYDKDKVSEDYQLIYTNSTINYYKASQLTIYPLSFFCMASSAYLIYKHAGDFFQTTIDMGDNPFVAGCVFFVVSFWMFFVTNDLCRGPLLRIYVHPERGDYVAIVHTLNFSTHKIPFTLKDTGLSSFNHYLPFRRGNLMIKGKPYILSSEDFITSSHYNTLCPYPEEEDD